MNLISQRKWLISIWGIGFLIPLLLIFIQGLSGKYGGTKEISEVVGWLTALTLPTILLMIGVMVGNPPTVDVETKTEEEKKKLKEKLDYEKAVFTWAVVGSLAYLFVINFVFWVEPLISSRPKEITGTSKIFLAIFDSMLSILIGYFFGKK